MNKTATLSIDRFMAPPPAGRYVVAVSGGVDSIVLLHMLAQRSDLELIVAHFDHGIRTDSMLDDQFVSQLARRYGCVYESRREELGQGASEELARTRRYAFLRSVAADNQAGIITAHHGDDVIETIAINLQRGTGWRGLAALDSDIIRPLLGLSKAEIIDYATQYDLAWREDSTNIGNTYLRNRLRGKISALLDEDTKRQLWALWATQCVLKRGIDDESTHLVGSMHDYSRYLLTSVDSAVADELLRRICISASGVAPTRPQRERVLLAIKTARARSTFEAGGNIRILIDQRTFRVELK